MNNITEIVSRLDAKYFGKHGVFGISDDVRRLTIRLYIDARKKVEFDPKLRDEMIKDGEPFTVELIFEPLPRFLSVDKK